MSEQQQDKSNLQIPVQGGGHTDKYKWTQEIGVVMVVVPVTQGTRAKQLKIEFKPNHLYVGIHGSEPILNGETFSEINPADCVWQLEDNREIILHLHKKIGTYWKSVIKGDQEIDVEKLEPPTAKLSELNGEMRATVEKMVFDQNAKALGLPTSEERLRDANVRKLQQMHPNVDWSKMDFSKAQFSFNN
jgi:hypothetical protein